MTLSWLWIYRQRARLSVTGSALASDTRRPHSSPSDVEEYIERRYKPPADDQWSLGPFYRPKDDEERNFTFSIHGGRGPADKITWTRLRRLFGWGRAQVSGDELGSDKA